jgi:drug/metabolite transporter (DMT)-like permease
MAPLNTLNIFGLELWVFVPILAAIAQTFRSAVQKKMKPILGDTGASYIRFSYALPFAWLGVFLYQGFSGSALPSTTLWFWIWVSFASLMQILFTILLIKLFSHRSFAAGTAFSKTEVLQAAIFEAFILGVVASVFTISAIILGAVAVVMLSLARSQLSGGEFKKTLLSRQTLIGLLSGSFLGLSTVFFKAAVLALNGDDWLLNAGYTGGIAVILQTLAMGGWLLFAARGELVASLVHWKASLSAGFFGAVATACWFIAFTLYAVAPVRAVGQIELLITLGISIFYFKEKTNKVEALAIILLAISIIMILLD